MPQIIAVACDTSGAVGEGVGAGAGVGVGLNGLVTLATAPPILFSKC